MIDWLRAWRNRKNEPSPSQKEIARQARRHEVLRAIATRNADGSFLEPMLFPEQHKPKEGQR